jgi:NAD-dependent deacetylase
MGWARKCDLMLAIGSSLVVTPAAEIPRVAKEHGAKLVIINRDPTPLDGTADVVIRESIGETLTQIVARDG